MTDKELLQELLSTRPLVNKLRTAIATDPVPGGNEDMCLALVELRGYRAKIRSMRKLLKQGELR